MIVDVHNLDGKKIETLELNDAVFNLEPNSELISAVVQWRASQKYPFRAKTLNSSIKLNVVMFLILDILFGHEIYCANYNYNQKT